MPTRSMEDYIEQIYLLKNTTGHARVSDLAKIMNVKPSSVTKMLQKLDRKNLLTYEKYYFTYLPTGRNDNPTQFTDTIAQVQGERGIIEVRFPYPGKYMFHAHVSEFAELGWMGFFEVE